MICNNCKNKMICKNYDYISLHSELTISDCTLKILQEEIKPKLFRPSQVFTKDNKYLKPIPMQKQKKEEKQKEKLIECPNCNGKTFEEDIKECSVCGALTCSACSYNTVDADKEDKDLKPKRICNKCYGIDEKAEKDNVDDFKTILLNQIRNGDDK